MAFNQGQNRSRNYKSAAKWLGTAIALAGTYAGLTHAQNSGYAPHPVQNTILEGATTSTGIGMIIPLVIGGIYRGLRNHVW